MKKTEIKKSFDTVPLKVHAHEILEKTKATAFLNTWLPAWLANSEKMLKGTHT
jgi:hypothetical protein